LLVAALALTAALSVPIASDAGTIVDVPAHGLVLPTAVAAYGKDRYVVADAALQRIFVVATDGTTTMLAGGGEPNALGSVPGGFADGQADAARFDAPQGIAAGAHGEVYVADTGNHCIRKITPRGTVTTVAGDPERAGNGDGPARTATFRAPRGITFDVNGDLLVADASTGIRRISPLGKVSTLQLP
jgi:catechol 2,3-dioxygenase-like lactoylglutathione lyase family enzyme